MLELPSLYRGGYIWSCSWWHLLQSLFIAISCRLSTGWNPTNWTTAEHLSCVIDHPYKAYHSPSCHFLQSSHQHLSVFLHTCPHRCYVVQKWAWWVQSRNQEELLTLAWGLHVFHLFVGLWEESKVLPCACRHVQPLSTRLTGLRCDMWAMIRQSSKPHS